MQSVIDYLFGAASFMPHGVCLLWRPDLVAMHAISDILIFLAYASIPAALSVFVRRRRDLEHRWAIILFALFILFCGLTHLVASIALWQPIYGLQGLVKVATAIISVLTAIAIWPLIPKLLIVPSPSSLQKLNGELETTNGKLTTEIAEHRETLRELNEMRWELELRVESRTRELAAANRQLEGVNADLSTFLHIASHDLKEPLRGIRHYAEIIADDHEDALNDAGKEDLAGIVRLADRMKGLINSLRAFSRAGNTEEVIEDIDLNDVIADAVDNLSPLLADSGTSVEVPDGLPVIRCARAHVLTVMQNLISNAAHHADKKGARVTVMAEKSANGVNISVRDNGPGIPEDMKSDVFKMFRRVGGADRVVSKGKGELTGMGLAIVKRIVERYNGTISLSDSPDGGAQFDLSFKPS